MGSYRIIIELQLAESVTPHQIRSLIEEHLGRDSTGLTNVKVRSIDGEFPTDRDNFNEWRYCLGQYAERRERMAELLDSRRNRPG